MKKFFKFALVALAAAALTVACKPDNPEDNKPDDSNAKTGWEGDWGVIGGFNSWGGDVEMTATKDGWYEAEVEIADASLEFKFRRDKTWGDYEYGLPEAGEVELDKEIALKEKGGNLKVPKAGVYKLELQPNKELAKVHFVSEPFVPAIKIDGNFDDWADIEGISDPSVSYESFKVTNDARNFYFYVETNPGSRLWSGGAYLYLYFDFDNDLTTGGYSGKTGMNGNLFEAYLFMYLFKGTADAPEVATDPNGGEGEGMVLDNIVIAGNTPATSSDIVKMEIVIPRDNFIDDVKAGDVIGVGSYRSKDGGTIHLAGYTVK